MLKEKIWVNFQRIIEFFTQKVVIKLSKIWVWDTGSEIWDPEKFIPDPGSRGQRHRIPDPGNGSEKKSFRIHNPVYKYFYVPMQP
jgi:hypothetical protein